MTLSADKLFKSEIYIGIKQILENKDMGVVDISSAMERFADKIKSLIPSC